MPEYTVHPLSEVPAPFPGHSLRSALTQALIALAPDSALFCPCPAGQIPTEYQRFLGARVYRVGQQLGRVCHTQQDPDRNGVWVWLEEAKGDA